MRISVAICTYNGTRYLGDQLKSILSQKRPPDEVVICDDNSADHTLQVLEAFAARAKFSVRILSNPATCGSTNNFDKAIQLCTGDVIVLADQDDKWKEEKLERLEAIFLADPEVDYVFSDGDVIDDQGRLLGCSMWQSLGFGTATMAARFKENPVLFLLRQNVVTGAAMAFRASLVRAIHPIPSAWLHDHWIAILGSVFGRGTPLSERLIFYRQHPNQQKGVRRSTIAKRVRESIGSSESDLIQKIERLKELDARIVRELASTTLSDQNAGIIEDKIRHLSRRSTVRSSVGFAKVKTVFSEAVGGGYHRFSESWVSIARDLLS